ncbi:type II secretion system F family protein [Halomonas vilamensis]|uniref:Type II secretion system F family protein n=1 Tax=Vreelandella vilamensis TaxID=531309 RepID=A0ABU1H5F6_9GAMM|nr:type II secretion system F family protein [Halomonas vilamensis]MDR5899535.1 type II secretion system F family protein [Halomonas vilamensis]
MDALMQWLQPFSNTLDDPKALQLIFASMLGLAIFALLIAVTFVVMGFSDPLRQRLRKLETSSAGAVTGEAGASQWLGPMGERLVPTEEKSKSRIARELQRAGKRSPGAVNVFFGVRLLLTVVPPILLLVLLVPFVRLDPVFSMVMVAGSAITGYLLPRFWLERTIKRRTRLLRRGLPDALDLLVVCSEAGLGLGAAIQRVARDLEISHPELAEELHLFGLQTRAGMDNKSALRDLEERTGVDDIRGLVTTLLQSMRFGTSIAMTLRLFAVELRDKRTQEAEEKAAKVSTKMLFPLIFCVFPSFFVVALGPPLLGAMAALAGR